MLHYYSLDYLDIELRREPVVMQLEVKKKQHYQQKHNGYSFFIYYTEQPITGFHLFHRLWLHCLNFHNEKEKVTFESVYCTVYLHLNQRNFRTIFYKLFVKLHWYEIYRASAFRVPISKCHFPQYNYLPT